MTTGEAFADDLGSQAHVSRAFGAAKVRGMAIQIITGSSPGSICRLVGVHRTSRVCALFTPAERDRGKEIDWKK